MTNFTKTDHSLYTYQYDYVVMIGRFQPPHIGHLMVCQTALTYGKTLIILVGSSNQSRTIKNPWNYFERASNLMNMLGPESFSGRVVCVPIRDKYNDQQWTASVQEAVAKQIASSGWTDKPPRVAVIGHKKDESSYYLDLFPQWNFIPHEMNEHINATEIRDLYFEQNIKFLQGVLPASTYGFLNEFQKRAEYKVLCEEHEFIKNYKAEAAKAPHPPTYVTVDAVVIQSGHVLVVRRKDVPGKDLIALPGGFLNQKERLQDACFRELKEETKINVPLKVLEGSIKSSKVFDAPERSLRGRTITFAFLIELPAGPLPKVKGSDDAAKAWWLPLSEVREEEMFEDHFNIIHSLVGVA